MIQFLSYVNYSANIYPAAAHGLDMLLCKYSHVRIGLEHCDLIYKLDTVVIFLLDSFFQLERYGYGDLRYYLCWWSVFV
jgi:hypothetical protein